MEMMNFNEGFDEEPEIRMVQEYRSLCTALIWWLVTHSSRIIQKS